MIDLRLYKPSGQYVYNTHNEVEIMDSVVPDDTTTSSIEVIAGKVVKFMLTEKGSDAFNPDYGSISMHHMQISQIYIPELRREVDVDVAYCERFLKQAEIDCNVVGEKLYKINVMDVVYKPLITPNRVDVYLEIITTYGKHACVAITNRTNS